MKIVNAVLIEKFQKKFIFQDANMKKYYLDYTKETMILKKSYQLIVGVQIDSHAFKAISIATPKDLLFFNKQQKRNKLSEIFYKDIDPSFKKELSDYFEGSFESISKISETSKEEFLLLFEEYRQAEELYQRALDFKKTKKKEKKVITQTLPEKSISLTEVKEKYKNQKLIFIKPGEYNIETPNLV